MVEHDDEINVLGEINVELESGTHKLIEKLSQEKVSQEEALEKFNSMVERDDDINVLGEINVKIESDTNKLIEKLTQEKDSQEEAFEEFNSTLDNIVVVQNNVPQEVAGEVVFYPPVHEEVDVEVKERRPSKRIRVTQEKMIKDEKSKKG
ncbi:hypothetical protein Tco_0068580 [Tanacetum coccineum]